ncbi:MAG: DUF692 family protein [Myxococcaceae bacterium]
MTVRFPQLPVRGLGAGLDLPWDGKTGFAAAGIAPGLRAFLRKNASSWAHTFFSWQPRDRQAPKLDDYAPAWDALAAELPPELPRALHHTALNLASLERYERGELLELTAQLCERYALRWVNEDVGFWSLAGRALPYPLPPLLDANGLRATVANVREVQAALPVPLVLEFPGFSRGASVVVGDWHAYDFFAELAHETGQPVTLDTGHLLSWQWWRGRRGEALFDELERLPLSHCFEIHLSGCEIAGDDFIDAHHGKLLDEQHELLRRLLALCPNVKAITYEDPRFDVNGDWAPGNAESWNRLAQQRDEWTPSPTKGEGARRAGGASQPSPVVLEENSLAAYLYGAAPLPDGAHGETEAIATVRRMVLERQHRGTGGLRDWYPRTLAAWLAKHPADQSLHQLVAAFCASEACAQWREHGDGISLEEALYRFFTAEGLGDEDEFLSAVVRAIAVAPRARFRWPDQLHRTATGCVALTKDLILHAVVDGQYLRGPVTPLVAELLRGVPVNDVASRFGVSAPEVARVLGQMARQGLCRAA